MLGDRLKRARLDCGLTQQQVADLLGIDRSSYTYYETGKCNVSTQTLRILAVIFGIEFEWLLYDEPQKLVFHSSTRYKPLSGDDTPFYSANMLPEERKLLAQIRLIKFMGKDAELEEALKKLTFGENGLIPEDEDE